MHVCIFQKLGNGPVLYAVILVWLMSLPVSVKCVAMSNRLRKWVLFLFIEHWPLYALTLIYGSPFSVSHACYEKAMSHGIVYFMPHVNVAN